MTALLEVMPSSGSRFDVHLEPRPPDGARLGAARGYGPVTGRTGEAVAWLLVEGGDGELRVGTEKATVGGRADVFESPGWSILVPPAMDFALFGALRYSVVWRQSRRRIEPRLIAPTDVSETWGSGGREAQRLRTYLADGPIIAGETLTPPGGWASYPPHRHEQEQVDIYRFDPSQGFGVSVNYGDVSQVARIVHDGHVQRVTSGYHPVAAAPGYAMYYLWALAGQSDTLAPMLDPVHAWLS